MAVGLLAAVHFQVIRPSKKLLVNGEGWKPDPVRWIRVGRKYQLKMLLFDFPERAAQQPIEAALPRETLREFSPGGPNCWAFLRAF